MGGSSGVTTLSKSLMEVGITRWNWAEKKDRIGRTSCRNACNSMAIHSGWTECHPSCHRNAQGLPGGGGGHPSCIRHFVSAPQMSDQAAAILSWICHRGPFHVVSELHSPGLTPGHHWDLHLASHYLTY